MDFLNNKVMLPMDKIPKQWFNIKPYLSEAKLPLLLPNGVPADFESMCMIFPTECVKQAVSDQEFIDIPQRIREAYALSNRPTPLQRAFRLEKALGVDSEKVKIFYKCEYVSPTGSHKTNTALAQAYYAKQDKLKGLCTETGAGQWASALSYAGGIFDLHIKVFQVRISYQQKPGRVVLIKSYGAEIIPSPSNQTESGRIFYEKDPNHPGSLGIAISEAIETSMTSHDYKYALGSVVDFVCIHQSVIGLEAQEQMKLINEYPDVVIGCVGGGSNFAGLAFPFIKDKLMGSKPDLDVLAVEPTACPSLTKGLYTWDFGDSAHKAPIIKMYTLGSSFIPAPVHAGGLRYHGVSPLVSYLKKNGYIRSEMLHQVECMKAGMLIAKTEGVLPAPETCHAIASAINEAQKAHENNEKKIILFNFSGHGFFDTSAYQALMNNELLDYEYPDEAINAAIKELPQIDESKFM